MAVHANKPGSTVAPAPSQNACDHEAPSRHAPPMTIPMRPIVTSAIMVVNEYDCRAASVKCCWHRRQHTLLHESDEHERQHRGDGASPVTVSINECRQRYRSKKQKRDHKESPGQCQHDGRRREQEATVGAASACRRPLFIHFSHPAPCRMYCNSSEQSPNHCSASWDCSIMILKRLRMASSKPA